VIFDKRRVENNDIDHLPIDSSNLAYKYLHVIAELATREGKGVDRKIKNSTIKLFHGGWGGNGKKTQKLKKDQK